MKPEASTEVVFGEEEPSSIRTKRIARQVATLLSRVPLIGPAEPRADKTTYELERDTTKDAVQLTHTLRDLMSKETKKAEVKFKSEDNPYKVFAMAQAIDDPNLKVTDTAMHITSKAGTRTHLQITTREVPPEKNAFDLIPPEATITISNGQDRFSIDDYAPVEQQEFAHIVRRATSAIIEEAKPTSVNN